MGQLFSIGKVIQIRTDPLAVKRLAFVETEEHIRHVVEMLEWLYPNIKDSLQIAAKLHDIGKKVYLQPGFARRDRRLSQNKLRTDFYRNPMTDSFTPLEAIVRYLKFIEPGAYAKCFVFWQNQ